MSRVMRPERLAERRQRAERANELLRVIASSGRRFFHHDGRVAHLEVDERGSVWFVDAFTGDRIYTHYRGPWPGFSHGGTLRSVVESLKLFVMTGKPMLSYQADNRFDGDLWAYGDEIEEVRSAARRLGIIPEQEPSP